MERLLKDSRIFYEQRNRIIKAHYQSFYLLNSTCSDFEVVLHITGSTLNVYTVKILDTTITCNCPDTRKCNSLNVYCKHICFVICCIGDVYSNDIFVNKSLSTEDVEKILFNLVFTSKEDPNVTNTMLCKRYNDKISKVLGETSSNTTPRNLEEECPICYNNFEPNIDIFKCSECKNAIHTSCFNIWIQHKQECVFCRTSITKGIKLEDKKYLNIG